ncbi:phage tail protein [Xenorhabdus sp. XENO-10]|uniref:Phage tail protein n=1 Tax=Xenorhabdus yunnanensis TaxID=3025878 RepID=A0ABT5LCG5_9GAMM|nr:phage tail protein [Xenorhabdus yunnanensis]MDC9588196.1 phage tail protein [Xenorhabdus yunnanensis]
MSSGDVGAFSRGATAIVQGENGVPWDAASGSYIAQRNGDSQLVIHFNVDAGSTPALQLKTMYRNNGIAYRSARDRYGFEEPWTEFYTTKNKPSATDVGAYSKTESDNRFIRLNTNTKTSGYILSKTVNYFDDAGSRNLGLSGFLRPNEGLEKLGALAIHVAHPQAQGAQHARGISFNYGSDWDKFGISTYAFDEKGNFKGHRRILTEDDISSLTSIPVGTPLPWSQANPPSGYLVCNGQSFNKSTYPKLSLAYPSGKLPDLRGEFIRGLDDGRGADPSRKILTHQEGTIISGLDDNNTGDISSVGSPAVVFGDPMTDAQWASIKGKKWISWNRDGIENRYDWWAYVSARPRNIAFLYIVRAA